MNNETHETLKMCLHELKALYQKYENLSEKDAFNYSRAIQKGEALLKSAILLPDPPQEISVEESSIKNWEGINRRKGNQDRRSPVDRRRTSFTSRRK